MYARRQCCHFGMCVKRRAVPSARPAGDAPDPDGMNRRVGIVASLVTAHPLQP
jgi:hypothetical protein